MTKNIIILCFSIICLFGTVYSHPSFDIHYDDISCVFNGYGQDEIFKELSKEISSGIDSELPKLFKERFGKVPGNHRILGHGWTLNGSIPERILIELEKTYPGQRAEFIDLWRNFANKLTTRAEQLTGLPPKQAKALATMIYDIHLLGDLEPDNKLVQYVLTPKEIVNDFSQNAEILFKNKPEYAKSIREKLFEVLKSNPELEQKYVAQNLMDSLYNSHIGTMTKDTWGNTLRSTYSPDAVISANQKYAERPLRQIEGVSLKKSSGSKLSKINNTAQTKGFITKIAVNGKNVSVLKVLVPLKSGVGYGILTLALTEGFSYYSYSNKKIDESKFKAETYKNMGEAASVAGITVILVACGSNPVGWTVLAAGIATSAVYELTYVYAKPTVLESDDFIGGFPKGIFENGPIITMGKESNLILVNDKNFPSKESKIISTGKKSNIINLKNRNIID